MWPAGRADPIENTHVYYDGPILAFTGELDANLSGIAGYKIAMLYDNARNVVFRNTGHAQFYIRPYNYSPEEYEYRRCALALGRQFLADPQRPLDTSCAKLESYAWYNDRRRGTHPQLIEMIERAGFEAVERDTVYSRVAAV